MPSKVKGSPPSTINAQGSPALGALEPLVHSTRVDLAIASRRAALAVTHWQILGRTRWSWTVLCRLRRQW
jgi:hypothetical protein